MWWGGGGRSGVCVIAYMGVEGNGGGGGSS